MAIATALLTVILAAPPADEAPGYIGIRPIPLSAELRKVHKVEDDVKEGLLLLEVHDDTAAKKAGLRVGDVLTSLDNKPVTSLEGLLKLLEGKRAGDKVAYTARRGTGTIAGVLVLGKRPAEEPGAAGNAPKVVERGPDERDAVAPPPVRNRELEARAKELEAQIERLRAEAVAKHAQAHAREMARRHREGLEIEKREKEMRLNEKREAAARAPRRFEGWLEREEKALERAEQEKSVEKIIWHRARLQLLREMRESGFARAVAPRRNDDARVAKLEKRLQQVLERLEKLEERVK